MSRAQFTRAAELDLDEIWEFIARDNPLAASDWLDEIERVCNLLAETPGIGTVREDYLGLHMHPVGDYLIFYRPQPYGIEVIRVLHGARDIKRHLS
jgi:toxin ParE1/3/4